MATAQPSTRSLAELVFAGAFELAGADGCWHSGPQALDVLIAGDLSAAAVDLKCPARRSIDALLYALALNTLPLASLADRVYRYNMELRSALASLAYPLDCGPTSSPWTYRSFGDAPSSRLLHKLYVSPRARQLREVYESVCEAAGSLGFRTLKVASDRFGVLRPDKIVVYFASASHAAEAGSELASVLRGFPALGVPFARPLDETGLVSYAVDPPLLNPWHHRVISWRGIVSRQVARYAKGLAAEANALSMLLKCLVLDGFDPVRNFGLIDA